MTVSPSPMPQPGDPRYISVEEAARRDMARMAEFEARPHVVARRKADREHEERQKVERALRKKALVTSTNYPWLKPDWDWERVPLGFAKRPAS
jgi:hypothetical protein